MSDEVRDMIRSALADEPASGLEFERVVADGRRRRARRRFGALGAAVVGIVAVIGVTAMVGGPLGRAPSPPAEGLSGAPTTTGTASPGCAMPVAVAGFPDLPRGISSPGELAESGRLTDAFKRFRLPLPAGVEATPLELCAITESWGGEFEVTGDRTVRVYVRPADGEKPGDCTNYGVGVHCSTRALPDGSTARVFLNPGEDVTLATAEVWRTDGTYAYVAETGVGSKNRVLGDDQLVAIAAAPQLEVRWVRPVLAAPSDRRAAELDAVLARALPPGLRADPAPGDPDAQAPRFRVWQGGYRAVANLTDAAGSGRLVVSLERPDKVSLLCAAVLSCRFVGLADGRRAPLNTDVEGGVTRMSLMTRAADGTLVSVQTTNAADDGTEANTPTRPTPPLTEADLIRIVELADLHW